MPSAIYPDWFVDPATCDKKWWQKTGDYLKDSWDFIWKGDYSDKFNLVGLAGSILVGCTPVGIAADVRDFVHAVTNTKDRTFWQNTGAISIAIVAFVAVIGDLKHLKQLKHLDEGIEVGEAIAKNGEELIDAATEIIKQGDGSIDVGTEIIKQGDELGEGAVETLKRVVDSDTIIDSASKPFKGGESIVGHALQKHAGRNPDIWGAIKGNSEVINETAMRHIDDIISGPGDFIEVTNNRGITFLEKMLDDGRGIRLNLDGTFKGFIDQ